MKRIFRFVTRQSADISDDIRDEFAFHLDMRIEALRREGLSPAEARAQAVREFGNAARATRTCAADGRTIERRRLLARLASELRHDAKYGVRLIRRSPGFSAVAILTLSVAIGGNTAMFSVVNALFLTPLAIHAPHEIARIYAGESTISWPNADEIAQRTTAFSDVVLHRVARVSLAADPLPVRVMASLVSPNYFSALGAAPLLGQTLRPDDRRTDGVMLSERLWRARYGASPSIVGQRITVDERPREVIGVMPQSFRGIAAPGFAPQLWLPVDPRQSWSTDRSANIFEAYGRLAPGVSVAEAAAAMRVLGSQMAAEHPQTNQRFAAMQVFAASGIGLYRGFGNAMIPVFGFVGFLLVVAGFILAIGCANIAGLLLGRAAARRQEIAVRLALGAGRGRVVRQLLTESLILAILGGAGGIAVGAAITASIPLITAALPFAVDVPLEIDRRVLAYALAISTLSAIVFGLSPARRAARTALMDTLKAQTSATPARQRFRQALIIAQVSISALLLFWSGLFCRSLLQINAVDPGFNAANVLIAEIDLSDGTPASFQRTEATVVEIHRRVRELPGVDSAGWSTIVPLALLGNERFRAARADAADDDRGEWVYASRLSPGWFDAVRIPLRAGRDFTWEDREGSPPVAIVNETLARRYFGGAAIGERLRYGTNTPEIVGIVRDSKYWTLGETIVPTIYLPMRQSMPTYPPTLHVRTTSARATSDGLRRIMQELAPTAAIDMKAMPDAVAVSTLPAQVGAAATGAAGLLGALLATLGVYGLISYVVVQRSREVAIRRAIGAPTRHIIRTVIGSTAVLAAIGLALGIAAGALSAPALGGLLVNVSPRDPLTAFATAIVVIATAIAASALPALRAARVDPLQVLRNE